MRFHEMMLLGIVDYIENNIMGDLSLEKLSAISGYSKWYLQRLFKKNVGVCIGTYIRYRRLSKSTVMLRLSNVKILDVAIFSGFNTQQCYTRAFKDFFGNTPKEFRKNDIWDFSRHMPPYRVKGFYYYINSFQYHVSFFQRYRSLSYGSIINHNKINSIPSMETTKKIEKSLKFQPKSKTFKINGGVISCFFFGCRLPAKKYLVIPFHGESTQDYFDFYEEIYDRYLPCINAKIESNLIIELIRDYGSDDKKNHIDVIIPIIV